MREDWVECTFGEIIYFKNGFAFKSSDYINDGIPIIRIGDIKQNQISLEDSKRVKESNDLVEYLIRKGDILIAMSGATTGKFGMYNLESKAYLNQRVGNIFPISQDLIYKPFLFYLLHFLKRQIEKDAYGGAQPNISSKKIEEMKVPFIPLPEQRAIVKKIEALFSSLDAGIADLKKAQDQLKIYRQAVLKKAFEGEFEEVKLKEITTKIGSGSTPKGGNSNYKTSGIPLIRSLNIHFDYIKFKDLAFIDDDQAEKLKNVIVYENDVLLNITGASIGRVNLAPKEFDGGRVNQHVSIIRLKEDKAIPKYIKYYIQSSKVQDYINDENYGVTRQALTKGMIEDLLVPAITLEEQAQIVKEIEVRLSVCDAVEQQIKDSLSQAEALRQSILKKAFEGRLLSEAEVKACQQEADYEPAAMLLERIKAAKEALKPIKKSKKK